MAAEFLSLTWKGRWPGGSKRYRPIEHRAGTKHGNANALSRRPCLQSCTYCAQQDEREKGKRCQVEDLVATQNEWKLGKVVICKTRVDVDSRSNGDDLDTPEEEREVELKTLWTGE